MKRRYERTWSRWRVGSVATGTGSEPVNDNGTLYGIN